MVLKTHIRAGVLVTQPIVWVATNSHEFLDAIKPNSLLFILLMFLLGVMGATIPDLDHSQSKLSRNGLLLSFVSCFTKHRGAMHTPFFALCVGSAMGLWVFSNRLVQCLSLCILLGLLSHLILDTLNPTGIMWLYPYKRDRFSIKDIIIGKRRIKCIVTSSYREKRLSAWIYFLNIVVAIYLFIFL